MDWLRLFPDTEHRWAMGLRPVERPDDYFALREADCLAERRQWLREDPSRYLAQLPVAEAAIGETAALVAAMGLPLPAGQPLCALGEGCEPDLVWMQRGDDGQHHLVAGIVCFPSGWALTDMVGRPMHEVHALVPGLNAALSEQIQRFLERLKPGAAWRRENWGLSRDGERNHHPARSLPRLDASVKAEDVWLRIERQLLWKLPASGDLLFGIRLEIVPFRDVLTHAEAARRCARSLASMDAAAAEYKGLAAARPALLAMLQEAC